MWIRLNVQWSVEKPIRKNAARKFSDPNPRKTPPADPGCIQEPWCQVRRPNAKTWNRKRQHIGIFGGCWISSRCRPLVLVSLPSVAENRRTGTSCRAMLKIDCKRNLAKTSDFNSCVCVCQRVLWLAGGHGSPLPRRTRKKRRKASTLSPLDRLDRLEKCNMKKINSRWVSWKNAR